MSPALSKNWIFFLIIFVLVLLEVTLLDSFKIFGVKPDLLLVAMVIASLTFDFKQALVLSLCAGIFKDIFAPNSFGINTLLFVLWSFAIKRLSKKIPIEQDLIRVALVFIVVVLNDIILGLIFSSSSRFIALGIFLRIVFLESLYTAAISFFLFKAASHLVGGNEFIPPQRWMKV